MKLDFTDHARKVIEMRQIQQLWIVATLEDPELRKPDPNDTELERFYKRISDFDNRVLRVVVNTRLATWRIVSVFFDRGMKGKL